MFLSGDNSWQEITLHTGSSIDTSFYGYCTKYNSARVIGICKESVTGTCLFI